MSSSSRYGYHENLLSRGASGQKVEDVLDASAEPSDAQTTAADVGIHGDSVNGAHVSGSA